MGVPEQVEFFSPTTPAVSNKYNKAPRVTRSHRHIVVGEFCLREAESPCLPPLWKEYVHPEGNLYYVRDTNPRVVTDAYLPSPEIQEKIQVLTDQLAITIQNAKVTLPESVEVFLELDGDRCLYYMADHVTRSIFWLHPTATNSLSLRPVVSDSHLRMQLEELYWNHVEFFPVHQVVGFNLMLDQLTDALIQGRADGLMSAVSTFPYNAKECSQFLKLIKAARESDRLASVETKWSLARLWTMIWNTRFETHYGQEHCRLSRDQGILSIPGHTTSWFYRVTSSLMWNVPSEYSSSLEKLWVDDVVYGVLWRQYISLCLKEWTVSVAMSFATMIFNVLLFSTSTFSWLMALVVTLGGISALFGATLLFKYYPSTLDSASQAACFMSKECKEKTRFQKVSIIFSLPRALLLWALTLTVIRTTVSLGITHLSVSVAFVLLTFIVGCGFLIVRLAQKLRAKFHRSATVNSQWGETIV